MLTERQQKIEDKKPKQRWNIHSCDRDALIAVLLGDDPQSIVNVLLEELRQGTTEVELASIVCYAAALRIVQFHTRNEFSDWDAALHTFTFSNAVHQGLRVFFVLLLTIIQDQNKFAPYYLFRHSLGYIRLHRQIFH